LEKKATWLVMETSSKGEEASRQGLLKKRLQSISGIPEEDIYIPILNSGTSRPIVLIEGYIFIKSGYPTSSYLDIARSQYIVKMIAQFDPKSNLISQSTITDKELKNMVKAAYKRGGRYQLGSKVKVILGEFKGCEGEVIDIVSEPHEGGLVRDFYMVCVTLRSAEVILKMDSFSVGDIEHG
jgi:transcription antitermination factor NusG